MNLYNTTVRVVAQIRASSPEEARRLLAASLPNAEILPMEEGDVFISEADPEHGWDGEKFTLVARGLKKPGAKWTPETGWTDEPV